MTHDRHDIFDAVAFGIGTCEHVLLVRSHRNKGVRPMELLFIEDFRLRWISVDDGDPVEFLAQFFGPLAVDFEEPDVEGATFEKAAEPDGGGGTA